MLSNQTVTQGGVPCLLPHVAAAAGAKAQCPESNTVALPASCGAVDGSHPSSEP